MELDLPRKYFILLLSYINNLISFCLKKCFFAKIFCVKFIHLWTKIPNQVYTVFLAIVYLSYYMRFWAKCLFQKYELYKLLTVVNV